MQIRPLRPAPETLSPLPAAEGSEVDGGVNKFQQLVNSIREEFPRNELAQTVNLTMALAIGARAHNLSPDWRKDARTLSDIPIQELYLDGLEVISAAGIKDPETISEEEGLFYRLAQMIYAESRVRLTLVEFMDQISHTCALRRDQMTKPDEPLPTLGLEENGNGKPSEATNPEPVLDVTEESGTMTKGTGWVTFKNYRPADPITDASLSRQTTPVDMAVERVAQKYIRILMRNPELARNTAIARVAQKIMLLMLRKLQPAKGIECLRSSFPNRAFVDEIFVKYATESMPWRTLEERTADEEMQAIPFERAIGKIVVEKANERRLLLYQQS